MTEVSVFRPGSVSYLRIAAPDVARSAAFYRTVLASGSKVRAPARHGHDLALLTPAPARAA